MERPEETDLDGLPALVDPVEGDHTWVVLAHGAGSHMAHPTMEWLSGVVREAGGRVARFNFPYRAQGRSMPDRMPALVKAYKGVVDAVRTRLSPVRLVVGGHSMGGRVASMMEAEGQNADGLLLFSYPLHPPGQLAKLRDAHLSNVQTPTLQLSGTNDEFCDRTLMNQVAARLDPAVWRLRWLEGANHSYSVSRASGRTREGLRTEMVDSARQFFARLDQV